MVGHLTASNFAEICKRKSQSNKLVTRLATKPKLGFSEKMPSSCKHGKTYQDVAAAKYLQYMKNTDHEVEVLASGFVVRPDIPYLGEL